MAYLSKEQEARAYAASLKDEVIKLIQAPVGSTVDLIRFESILDNLVGLVAGTRAHHQGAEILRRYTRPDND